MSPCGSWEWTDTLEGWVAFKVELGSSNSFVEPVDLPLLLKTKTQDIAIVAIDIPIGLFDGPRECDSAARKLLGQPRGCSVFSPPCRSSLSAENYRAANATNIRVTGKGLTCQAWGIASKIQQVDDVIGAHCQNWVFEVHPEVCFWALAGKRPMSNRKKTADGIEERLKLLRPVFHNIDAYLQQRLTLIGKDDLLDAAVAAWTGLRLHRGEALPVCTPTPDERGWETTIWY
jgi:predicted RNase H-like nuclease